MPKTIISEGKTTNEAIENGLKQLKVSKNQVNIKVLENEEKRSFFSILAPRVVKVEITLKEGQPEKSENYETAEIVKKELTPLSAEELDIAEKNLKTFLEEFCSKIGNEVKYQISRNEYGLDINIEGKDAIFLIGYRGETLYAMQNVLASIASKGLPYRARITLNIAGFKEKREKTLEDLAEKIARTVVKTGKPITLEPMQAYERKIIHAKLQNSNKVTTRSIGEEPRRRIVVSLK